MSERTAVYRLYGVDHVLLYVGISKRFGQRWEQHARVQPWWPSVDHQTITWCASREDASLAEKRAIADERPMFNVQNSPWEARVKDDGTGFYVAPKAPRPRIVNRQNHTPNRVIRIGDEWDDFGRVAGRQRNTLIRQFIRWYLRHPGAELPARPPRAS